MGTQALRATNYSVKMLSRREHKANHTAFYFTEERMLGNTELHIILT